ncbi:GNAT family N-acetyltransferase [Psychroserpens sp.]|uniref:GNAT family N-acetyltransferase n=1 Tax=Psychroserpens sp. TaxID=2020870 RepID=UPI002B26E823|nr:GNAT family N-acetyltransferase [Psychroserpens sp.]
MIFIGSGNLKPILDGFLTRLYSKTNFIGLEASPHKLKVSDSSIDIAIRPFETSDINALNEKFRHSRLVEEQIPRCYVATNKKKKTVYRQWLFTHKSQQQVINYFGPVFPELDKNEAIIEGVFTHPDYRGLRIMSKAMPKIIKQQQYKNIKRVIAFVNERNISSLKGFNRIGFSPYCIRIEVWFLFSRKVSFIQMTDSLEKKYLESIKT